MGRSIGGGPGPANRRNRQGRRGGSASPSRPFKFAQEAGRSIEGRKASRPSRFDAIRRSGADFDEPRSGLSDERNHPAARARRTPSRRRTTGRPPLADPGSDDRRTPPGPMERAEGLGRPLPDPTEAPSRGQDDRHRPGRRGPAVDGPARDPRRRRPSRDVGRRGGPSRARIDGGRSAIDASRTWPRARRRGRSGTSPRRVHRLSPARRWTRGARPCGTLIGPSTGSISANGARREFDAPGRLIDAGRLADASPRCHHDAPAALRRAGSLVGHALLAGDRPRPGARARQALRVAGRSFDRGPRSPQRPRPALHELQPGRRADDSGAHRRSSPGASRRPDPAGRRRPERADARPALGAPASVRPRRRGPRRHESRRGDDRGPGRPPQHPPAPRPGRPSPRVPRPSRLDLRPRQAPSRLRSGRHRRQPAVHRPLRRRAPPIGRRGRPGPPSDLDRRALAAPRPRDPRSRRRPPCSAWPRRSSDLSRTPRRGPLRP